MFSKDHKPFAIVSWFSRAFCHSNEKMTETLVSPGLGILTSNLY